MPISRLRVLLLTLLLASVALWIANLQTPSTTEQPTLSNKPLAYSWQAQDTTVWKIDPQIPDKQTIIHAKNIHYQDDQKKSEFNSPDIQVINQNTLTQLSSQTGQSLNDRILTFNGNVVVKQNAIRAGLNDRSKTMLTTTSLSYDTKSNLVYSDEKVIIKQYNAQTSGTGLKADLSKTEFELLSDVKGTYYPQKTSQLIQSKGQQ
ncbi:hypothetical protein THMIRHAM_05760 [Thiomicrorhabdus immobilis]|uniref:LPS export ABC transporter periplasmic protein LptC n=1 Tax=Thiomicrorhabdus immobilis TaxID=2791037 RepID=A0ABN6CUW9_9GAMM|nr:LPS export ABC transporter periplasmic protein LptC [Thiomicrorhabdus immobilis]BCN92791.1 hypothetical protein THMIRHAM_05760 [Thiomicrorhabdus immobilis]